MAAEITVYVGLGSQRRGVGRALYVSLLACLSLQGYRRAAAVITLPNSGSVGLHENMGFRSIGVFNAVGYKLGKWHDVGWWQLDLAEPGHSASQPEPAPPTPAPELLGSEAWDDAVAKGLA